MADNINEKLREWRESRRLKQKEAGDLLGISRNYYANLEYGQSIPEKVMNKLRELGYEGSPASLDNRRVEGMEMVPVPVDGSVAAGNGEFSVDADSEPIWVPSFMTFPGCRARNVIDDSMYPRLHHGDCILYRPTSHPLANRTFVLYSESKGWQIKKLRWKQGIWYAHSINPTVEDFPMIDIQICGMLTGIFGKRDGAYFTLSSLDGLHLIEADE